MTADEQPAEDPEVGEQPGKVAGGCVAVVLASAAGAVVYAVPETAYFAAGLLAAAGVRKARAWAAGRRKEEQPEAAPVDIAEHLRALSGGTEHVRLTQLQEAAGLPDTKAVRALLDEAGIRVAPGVRAGGKNGPGVHVKDIPPPLSRDDGSPDGRCLCRSDANANANTGPESGAREGFRVEAIGQAGTVVHDPAEAQRHHAIRAH